MVKPLSYLVMPIKNLNLNLSWREGWSDVREIHWPEVWSDVGVMSRREVWSDVGVMSWIEG